jgi:hypothetical protein
VPSSVYSNLSTNWIRPYGLGALAFSAAALAGLWVAWTIRTSTHAGLMPQSKRTAPASLFAVCAVLLAFVVPPIIDWIGVKTIPTLLRGPSQPAVFNRPSPPMPQQTIPWHAEWINPDSALFVAVIGYALVILLGLWLWLGTLRLRERLRRIEPSGLTSSS